jgi:hypothetical protein
MGRGREHGSSVGAVSAGGYDTLPGTVRTLSVRTLSVRTIRWPPTRGVSMAIGIWVSAEVKSIAATVPSAKMHPQETGYVRESLILKTHSPG